MELNQPPICLSPWPSCLSLSEAFITTAGLLVVMLVIVFGNLMVVLVVQNDQKLRSQRQNWLLVSLAVADLLVGAVVMPLTTIYEIVGVWVLGPWTCEAWLALDVLFVTASILHICIISLDRYWSVTQPLTYPSKRTPTRISLLIGLAWFLSILICSPPVLSSWMMEQKREPGECSVSKNLTYVLYSALGSFYIPVGVLIVVYWRIYTITKHHSRQRLKDTRRTDETLYQLTSASAETTYTQVVAVKNTLRHESAIAEETEEEKATTQQNGREATRTNINAGTRCAIRAMSGASSPDAQLEGFPPDTCTPPPGGVKEKVLQNKKDVDRRRRMLKLKERQATLLLGLLLTAFIASWLPFFLMYVLGAFGYQAPIFAFKFFFWLGYCNSAINPIIYTLFNREFKRALYRLIRRHQHYFRFIIRKYT